MPEFRKLICCLCEKEITPDLTTDGEVYWDQGHNPEPISKVKGDRCCTDCNNTIVIPRRLDEWAAANGVATPPPEGTTTMVMLCDSCKASTNHKVTGPVSEETKQVIMRRTRCEECDQVEDFEAGESRSGLPRGFHDAEEVT